MTNHRQQTRQADGSHMHDRNLIASIDRVDQVSRASMFLDSCKICK
jgi:hypothetical protein